MDNSEFEQEKLVNAYVSSALNEMAFGVDFEAELSSFGLQLTDGRLIIEPLDEVPGSRPLVVSAEGSSEAVERIDQNYRVRRAAHRALLELLASSYSSKNSDSRDGYETWSRVLGIRTRRVELVSERRFLTVIAKRRRGTADEQLAKKNLEENRLRLEDLAQQETMLMREAERPERSLKPRTSIDVDYGSYQMTRTTDGPSIA